MREEVRLLYAAPPPENQAIVDAAIHEMLMSQQETTEPKGEQYHTLQSKEQ